MGRAGNGSAGRAQGVVHRGALGEHDRGAIREASQAIALRARAIDADVNGNRAGRRRRAGSGSGSWYAGAEPEEDAGPEFSVALDAAEPDAQTPPG